MFFIFVLTAAIYQFYVIPTFKITFWYNVLCDFFSHLTINHVTWNLCKLPYYNDFAQVFIPATIFKSMNVFQYTKVLNGYIYAPLLCWENSQWLQFAKIHIESHKHLNTVSGFFWYFVLVLLRNIYVLKEHTRTWKLNFVFYCRVFFFSSFSTYQPVIYL